MRHWIVCLLCLAIMGMPAGAESAYYGSHPADDVYQVQTVKHTCTLIACTMMLRNYSSLRGSPYIQVTESGVARYGWIDGVGLSHSFSIGGVTVAMCADIRQSRDPKTYLIDMLRSHPEGVVLYDTGAPHAIWLFGYDGTEDTFWCADTFEGRGGRAIPLAESSIRGATQQAKVDTIDRIWYIEDGGHTQE